MSGLNKEFIDHMKEEQNDLIKQMKQEIKMEIMKQMLAEEEKKKERQREYDKKISDALKVAPVPYEALEKVIKEEKKQDYVFNVSDLVSSLPLPAYPNLPSNIINQDVSNDNVIDHGDDDDIQIIEKPPVTLIEQTATIVVDTESEESESESEEEILNTHIPVVSIDRKSNLKGIQLEQELEDEEYNWKNSQWKNTHRDYYAFNHPFQPSDTYEDSEYFNSYSRVSIHNEMVFDKRRTEAYYQAIMKSKDLFKDKVVMDVGCGTGLLSCFAAMAGAKRVYAVEASDMAYNAELIVNRNNLQDIVRIYKGKVEHIAFPEYVDIIISEWMGAFLIFESMLESVIYARDHLLKRGGLLFPSRASLYVSPVKVESFMNEKVNCWANDVYGLDMSPLVPFAQQEVLNKTIRDHYIEPSDILDSPYILRDLDLYTITIESLSRTVLNFDFKLPNGPFHGFASWFSVYFEGLDRLEGQSDTEHKLWIVDENGVFVEKPYGSNHHTLLSPQPFELSSNTLELSTAPGTGATHWKQLLFLFEQPKEIYHYNQEKQTSATIKGTMRVSQHLTYRRHWWVELNATLTVNSTNSGSYQNYLI